MCGMRDARDMDDMDERVAHKLPGSPIQPHDSRCLGWMCELRDSCARHMEEGEVVLRQWFQPINTGVFCENFVRSNRPENAGRE